MRKVNAILTAVLLLLFAVHAVLGGFNLLDVGSVITKNIARVIFSLAVIHAFIGFVLSVQTIVAQKKAGVSYFKENKVFWARRVSGIAVLVFIVLHVLAFTGVTAEHFRLPEFTAARLCMQIMFVVSLAVHVIMNVKPMLLGFGVKAFRQRSGDIAFILSVILLFAGVAFIVYYLRWVAI